MKPVSRLIVFFAFFFLCGFLQIQKDENAALEKRIQRIETGLVALSPDAQDSARASRTLTLSSRMEHYKIPGVSIAVVNNNEIEWAKAYGSLAVDKRVPVTTESIFQAASTTKLLVSAIALHFVQQGKFDLDRDVNTYLQTWKIPENEFTQKRAVTLRLLLTHQSGLNRPDGGFPLEEGSAPSLVQVLEGEYPAKNKPAVVEIEPGSQWQYSNFDFIVMQLLLEDSLGKPLIEIARETVFEPLGMKSSTLAYPLSGELAKREAYPHDAEGRACQPDLHPSAVAQGGLMTTPSDLALLAVELTNAYRGGSSTVLSRDMARRMFRSEVDIDPRVLGVPMGQGLGVFVRGEGKNLSFLHPGDNYPGSTCWLVGYPELGQGAVIMTNGAMGNMLAMEILTGMAKEYGWPMDR